MIEENFIYCLQGFFEISEYNEGLSPRQVQVIKDHIGLVITNSDKEEKICSKKEGGLDNFYIQTSIPG